MVSSAPSRLLHVFRCRDVSRNADEERRTLADFTFQPDISIMHSDVFFDDGQSQSRSRCFHDQWLFFVTVETVPDAILLFPRNTYTRIGHADDYVVALLFRAYRDLTAS